MYTIKYLYIHKTNIKQYLYSSILNQWYKIQFYWNDILLYSCVSALLSSVIMKLKSHHSFQHALHQTGT